MAVILLHLCYLSPILYKTGNSTRPSSTGLEATPSTKALSYRTTPQFQTLRLEEGLHLSKQQIELLARSPGNRHQMIAAPVLKRFSNTICLPVNFFFFPKIGSRGKSRKGNYCNHPLTAHFECQLFIQEECLEYRNSI